MKERSQCSDGSRHYGNGVWGPSTADLQRSNLSFNEKPKIKEEPNNDLLFISSESVFGRFLQTASRIRLPAKFAIPLGLAVAVVAVACGSKNSEESKLPSAPRPSESGAPPPENPLAVLKEPFKKDPKMQIQQAWTSDFEKEHHAIDYIKGEIDNSKTWKSFEVDAAADGFACANPPSRQGNAVWMEHHIGNDLSKQLLGYTYYGHLAKIEGSIPPCESKEKPIFEKQDAKVGDAGSTGAPDAAWIHLHFAVKDANQNPIDPYDLKKERDVYPDPNFKNGKPCGPQALFIDCYPKGAVVASPKDPIPPISGKVTEKSVSVAEKPVEKGWSRFKSSILPYQIDIPLDWKAVGHKSADIFIDSKQAESFDQTFLLITLDNSNDKNIAELTQIEINRNSNVNEEAILLSRENTNNALAPLPNLKISDYYTNWISFKYNPAPGLPVEGVAALAIKDGKVWTIHFQASSSRFEQDIKIFKKIFSSFTLTVFPTINATETPKLAVEKKISLSKKPEELYRALLTNSISMDVLPEGMSSGGISASEIDATGKALKQIGAVNILIEDSVSKANGGVAYAIFPDSATAKSASELVGTHLGNGQVLEDFPYPTKIYTIQGIFETSTTVILMSVQNVTVVTSLTGSKFIGTNVDLMQPKTISLAHAAIEHLGKVGK